MRRTTATACLLLPLLPCATALAAAADETDIKMSALLMPVVRVTDDHGGGSGTVAYSADRDEPGRFETFVLTNHHVIADSIRIVQKWNSLRGRYENVEQRDRVKVQTFMYDKGKVVSTQDFDAEIVAHSESHDLAVLRLCYPHRIDAVAPLLPPNTDLRLFQPVYAVGCSLLHEPIATSGHITDLEDLLDGETYCMCTANVIFGNSGGALFAESGGTWYLSGIPSRVAVSGFSPITHMAWFIPPDRIRQWIADQKLDFLIDPGRTPKQCFQDRATMMSASAHRPGLGGEGPEPFEHDEQKTPPRRSAPTPTPTPKAVPMPQAGPEPAVAP